MNEEGKWEWTSGPAMRYQFWHQTQPTGLVAEDCGKLSTADMTLHDEQCSNELVFICQRKMHT
jgi:hypothetical protein